MRAALLGIALVAHVAGPAAAAPAPEPTPIPAPAASAAAPDGPIRIEFAEPIAPRSAFDALRFPRRTEPLAMALFGPVLGSVIWLAAPPGSVPAFVGGGLAAGAGHYYAGDVGGGIVWSSVGLGATMAGALATAFLQPSLHGPSGVPPTPLYVVVGTCYALAGWSAYQAAERNNRELLAR